MTAPDSVVVPREQAFAEARAVLDRARARRDADRAAGRLSPAVAALLDQLAPRRRFDTAA